MQAHHHRINSEGGALDQKFHF